MTSAADSRELCSWEPDRLLDFFCMVVSLGKRKKRKEQPQKSMLISCASYEDNGGGERHRQRSEKYECIYVYMYDTAHICSGRGEEGTGLGLVTEDPC